MIFKSIKWRLQLWYGLVLLAVLLGFGITAFQLERGREFRRVDDELHRRAGVLLQALHRPVHGPHHGQPPFADHRLPGLEDERPPERDDRTEPLQLPSQFAALFDAADPGRFYFVIFGNDGKEIAHSTNAPAQLEAGTWPTGNPQPTPPLAPAEPREEEIFARPIPPPPQPVLELHGHFREMRTLTPAGERILVGRDVAPELAELHVAALELAGFGGIILFVGLAGGWILVSRALRPISEISTTAAGISAGDLSQRISSAETESELGRLAAVLNSTFARLETAFAQQKQFAADAAHELRTPVSVILTQTQTALTRDRDAASYRQTIEACEKAAQRMRRLIELLLELARFDAGQEVLQRSPFDLGKTTADCVALVHPLADARRLRIIVEVRPLTLNGDPDRLAQVITNLLMNAIQFNQPNGEVRVRLKREDNLAILDISDTGPGIAPEDLPRLFERFYRGDKSRTGGANSGLGLSICKAVVEAHGGTIEAASAPTTGTTFTVRLPI